MHDHDNIQRSKKGHSEHKSHDTHAPREHNVHAGHHTQDFLKKNYRKYPGIFRKSWASWLAVKNKAGQAKLGDF